VADGMNPHPFIANEEIANAQHEHLGQW
jgi:hypothetical protein